METKVKIELESKEALTSIKDIRKAIKDTKDEMVGLEAGSDAFRAAAKRAGELQHRLDEIQQSVRGASSDFGDMLGNITKAGAGITGAFQAAQGAMSLLGSESEDVTKAIEKMQSIMAMTQGLASIDQGIKAFKKLETAIGLNSKELGKFKKALIGTGLGALVVVLGSIVANWDEFTQEIGLSEKQMNKFGETFGGVANVILKSSGKIASAFAKIVKGDFSGAWDEIKSGWDFQAMYAEGVQKAITKREEKELKEREKQHEEYVKKMEAEYDRQASKANATISGEIERTKELIRIENERLKLYKEGSKEYYDQLKKLLDLKEQLGDPNELVTSIIQDLYNSLENMSVKKSDKSWFADYIIPDEEEVENIEQWLKERLGAINFADAIIGDQETFLEKLDSQQSILDEYFQKGLISEEKYSQASNELAKQRADYHVAAAGAAMQGIGQLFSSLADLEDGETEESFEKQKKLQIAGATMSMLGGITAALSGLFTTKSGPWDIALAAIQASTIAASGAAQIANIKKQTYKSSASSGATRPVIAPAAISAASPVQYTQDVQHEQTIDALQDTKVYVTETDITNTQKKVDITESESKF